MEKVLFTYRDSITAHRRAEQINRTVEGAEALVKGGDSMLVTAHTSAALAHAVQVATPGSIQQTAVD